MKKILFLDIDGVLAGLEWFEYCSNNGKAGTDFLDPKLVQKLNQLDCEVVISSSWGYDGGKTIKLLKNKGLNLKVIGYTEHHEMGSGWIVRGNSIKKWLYDNCKDIDYQYAILDDDGDMLLEQKDHFVQTNPEVGVTDEDIILLKNILNSNTLW